MREEKEIRELIKEIESGDSIGKDNRTGLTEITAKGDAWIESLKWVLNKD